MGGPNLLPEWLRWVWIVVYAVILIVHLRHAWSKGGQRRAWHGGHIVMALGMAYMFLPMRLQMVSNIAWEVGFIVAAAAIFAGILHAWTAKRAVNFLWVLSLLHMLAMVYMFALPNAAVAVLTYTLVAYFAFEAAAWLVGAFDDVGERRRLLPFAIGPRSPESGTSVQSLVGVSPAGLRATLCMMAAGMAYMFVAMQLGM